MTKLRRIVGRVEATARVDGEIVCTAEFGFALANAGFPYETGTSGDE
jgi:3-hydroxymyristoyl/3-hydroxydecanoyl-(acyl carrier protein) dehydratase